MSKKSGQQQTTQTTEPWSGIQPYLQGGYEALINLYFPNMTTTGGETVPLGGVSPSAVTSGRPSPGDPRYHAFDTEMAEGGGQILPPFRTQPGATPSIPSMDFGSIATPEYFPGETVAGFTPAQLQGQESLMEYAGALPGQLNEYGNVLRDMTSATPNMSVWGPLMDQVTKSATRGFTEEIMPAIRSEAIGAGQYGGPKHGIGMGLAAGRLADALTNTQERLAATAGTEALKQQGIGASLMPGYFGMGTMPGDIMSQVGAQQQGLGQAQIQAEMDRWNFGQQAPFGQIADFMSLLQGGPAYSNITSTTPTSSNPLMQGAGGAMTGLGMNAMLSMNPATAGFAAANPWLLPLLLGGGALFS